MRRNLSLVDDPEWDRFRSWAAARGRSPSGQVRAWIRAAIQTDEPVPDTSPATQVKRQPAPEPEPQIVPDDDDVARFIATWSK